MFEDTLYCKNITASTFFSLATVLQRRFSILISFDLWLTFVRWIMPSPWHIYFTWCSCFLSNIKPVTTNNLRRKVFVCILLLHHNPLLRKIRQELKKVTGGKQHFIIAQDHQSRKWCHSQWALQHQLENCLSFTNMPTLINLVKIIVQMRLFF